MDISDQTPALESTPNVEQKPDYTLIHTNVTFANNYRLELLKHLMSITVGVFVFTITFNKEILNGKIDPSSKFLLQAGWVSLLISLVGGLIHFASWDRFYMNYADNWKDTAVRNANKNFINFWLRFGMWIQYISFITGLSLIAVFAITNFN